MGICPYMVVFEEWRIDNEKLIIMEEMYFLQTVEKFLFCLRRGTFLKKVPKKLQVGSVGKKKY